MSHLEITRRTRSRRLPERQRTERAELYAVLDDALVATVSTVREGEPFVLPMAVARDGDRLLLHGSSGAGLLGVLVDGAPVAVCVTHVDALVFARSAFDSSMNYRSAVVFGVATPLEGEDKLVALAALTAHLMPGRWDEVRPPTRKELAATVVLSMPLDEASVKVRDGGASGEEADEPGVWAGVVPVTRQLGDPVSAEDATAAVPASVHRARQRFSSSPHQQPDDDGAISTDDRRHRPQQRTGGAPRAGGEHVQDRPDGPGTRVAVGRSAGSTTATARLASVRLADSDEVDRVIGTLLSGFDDDPLYRWLLPDTATRKDGLRSIFDLLLTAAQERDSLWVLDDLSAAAVYTVAGVDLVDDELVSRYRSVLVDAAGDRRAEHAMEGMAACASQEPAGPKDVLHNIAVRADAHGQGRGSRLLRALLDEADRRRAPCCLESSNPRNHSFYARLGFTTRAVVTVPGDGPAMTLMLRRAQEPRRT
jgi:hypothetical protein